MIIRLFLLMVLVAVGYLMTASPMNVSEWAKKLNSPNGFQAEPERPEQLQSIQQELALIKQQYAELKLALLKESTKSAEYIEQNTDFRSQHQRPQELLELAERMELRAIEFSR